MTSVSNLAAEEEAQGYRGAHDYEEPNAVLNISNEQRELFTGFCYELAGACSVPFMRDNPNYVMPAEELSALVRAKMREFGVEPAY